MDDMQTEIDGWYAKFAKQEGLSMADAQIKLSKADQDYYARRARELCELAEIDMKAGNRDHANIYFSDLANDEMRIYNAKMRISRMEALKGMLRLETMRATGLIDQRMHDILIKDAEDKLRKEAKILGPTVLGAIDRIPTIVRASFHGATFSKRLWGSHQDTMKKDLQKILARGLIMGESPERFRKQIQKDLQIEGKKAKAAAKRLLRTEFARVQVQAQVAAFEEIDIEEFQFVTAAGCCDDCQANDGKIFKLKKGETGGNLPPMHPHCRCAIAPYSDRKEYDEWLDSYKDHGLNFEEWKDWKDPEGISFAMGSAEQEYKSVALDTEHSEPFTTKFGEERKAYPILERPNWYVEEGVGIKRRQVYEINKAVAHAMKVHGINNLGRTKIVIVSDTTLSVGALAAYDPTADILKIGHYLTNDAVFSEKQSHNYVMPNTLDVTMIHELFHWKDAKEYREKLGEISLNSRGDYFLYRHQHAEDRVRKLLNRCARQK